MTVFPYTLQRRIPMSRLASPRRRDEDHEVSDRLAAGIAAIDGQRYAGDHRGGIAE
jgi:hypothetical protein